MKTKFFYIPFLAGFAFAMGYTTPASNKQVHVPAAARTLSSLAATYDDYASIPCPTIEEVREYIRIANIRNVPPVASCDNSSPAKLFKIFKLAQLLKFNAPNEWAGSAQPALSDPYNYISKSTPELFISTATSHAIASNYLRQKIELGHTFFNLSPLKALEVLIHENRHSHENSAPHLPCLNGDLPKTGGACDAIFLNNDTTGAYSFGTLFSLGYSLYGEDLSDSTRQELMNSALSVLSTRFNNVPYNMGVPLDLLYVLDNTGQVYQVHPFTFEQWPISISTLPSEKIVRIKYSALYSGLLAFTDQGRIYAVAQSGKQVDYYSSLLNSDRFIIDSEKVFVPSADYSFTFFVEQNGAISYKDAKSSTGEDVLVLFRKNLPFTTKRFFGALGARMFALSEDGDIHEFKSGGPGGLRTYKLKSSALPGVQWIDANGGITYDHLYATGSDGLIYFLQNSLFDDRPIAESDFLANENFEKFQESLNIKMGRTRDGKLYAWDFARSTEKPWRLPLPPVTDFAIGRRYVPSQQLHPLEGKNSTDLSHCNVEKTFLDPWSQRHVGFSKSGQIIFEGLNDMCLSLTDSHFAPSVSLGTLRLTKINTYYDQTYLRLKLLNSGELPLFPYKKD